MLIVPVKVSGRPPPSVTLTTLSHRQPRAPISSSARPEKATGLYEPPPIWVITACAQAASPAGDQGRLVSPSPT